MGTALFLWIVDCRRKRIWTWSIRGIVHEANLKQFARFANVKNIISTYERSPRNGTWWCTINARGTADAGAYIERKANISLFGVI